MESSKSAMKTEAPELSALMIIFRSTGPVISTRRSSRSAGIGATFHPASRISAVSGRKSGRIPWSIRFWTSTRRARISPRLSRKARSSEATNLIAAGVRISSYFGPIGPRISIPSAARLARRSAKSERSSHGCPPSGPRGPTCKRVEEILREPPRAAGSAIPRPAPTRTSRSGSSRRSARSPGSSSGGEARRG